MTQLIEFIAQVARVQTMADGGIRVVLDLPETASMVMAQLAECQRFGVVLEVEVTPKKVQDKSYED